MKSRVIHTKIWNDNWFTKQSSDVRFMFLYLLTNEFTNVLDLYELPIATASYQTGLTPEKIDECLQSMASDKKIDIFDGYVLLNNGYKYQFYHGIKNNYAKLRIIIEMSDKVISHYSIFINSNLLQIRSESLQSGVQDDRFWSLYQRVINRCINANVILNNLITDNLIGDTRKNTEYKIQNTEIKNQNSEKEELSKTNLTSTPEYQKLAGSVPRRSVLNS